MHNYENFVNLGKRTPNIAIIPAILNSFPPSRLVFLHTLSLLRAYPKSQNGKLKIIIGAWQRFVLFGTTGVFTVMGITKQK